MRLARRGFAIVALVIALVPACTVIEPEVGEQIAPCVDADSNPSVAVSFKDQIRPIMNGDVPGPRPCADCHYTTRGTHEGIDIAQLNLDTLGTLRRGGVTTSADILVAGKPCSSALVLKLRGTYHVPVRMPKNGPYWSPEQIQLVIDWVFEGAKGADTE